ncbi:MAG: oligosaccharide flippase family protein, partial [Pirellulales bacterium]|nr:oligosaccharide flippase family protein [Pirellulales bacterium]
MPATAIVVSSFPTDGGGMSGEDSVRIGQADTPPADQRAERSLRDGATKLWRLAKSSVAETVGTQMGIFGLQAIHSIVLARILGPEGRGEYSTVVFYSQTLLYAGMLGSTFSIARRARRQSDRCAPLANASVRLGLTTGTWCFLVVSLLAWFALPSEKSYLMPWCVAAALLLPLEHGRLALLAVDHGRGKFRKYNVNRLLAAVIFPLLIGAAWLMGYRSLSMVVGMVVLTPLISLLCLLAVHPEVGVSQRADPPVGKLIRESIPYGSGYFAAQMIG